MVHSQSSTLVLNESASARVQTLQVAIFSLFPANHLRFAYVITIAASSNRKLGISNFDSNCPAFCPMILHGKFHGIEATSFLGGNAFPCVFLRGQN